ncbi:MAG TPA: hypothetical protein VEP49_05130 [Acidimicrobiia bacterium]|nr:hypothetical protein [Acidimicrobiia bacterium]
MAIGTGRGRPEGVVDLGRLERQDGRVLHLTVEVHHGAAVAGTDEHRSTVHERAAPDGPDLGGHGEGLHDRSRPGFDQLQARTVLHQDLRAVLAERRGGDRRGAAERGELPTGSEVEEREASVGCFDDSAACVRRDRGVAVGLERGSPGLLSVPTVEAQQIRFPVGDAEALVAREHDTDREPAGDDPARTCSHRENHRIHLLTVILQDNDVFTVAARLHVSRGVVRVRDVDKSLKARIRLEQREQRTLHVGSGAGVMRGKSEREGVDEVVVGRRQRLGSQPTRVGVDATLIRRVRVRDRQDPRCQRSDSEAEQRDDSSPGETHRTAMQVEVLTLQLILRDVADRCGQLGNCVPKASIAQRKVGFVLGPTKIQVPRLVGERAQERRRYRR